MPISQINESTLRVTSGWMTEAYSPRKTIRTAKKLLSTGQMQNRPVQSAAHKGKYNHLVGPNKPLSSREVWVGPLTFDTIVGTGVSGSILLQEAAQALKCNWVIVRKSTEGTHANELLEGTLGKQWILFDDFIGTGNTFKRVYRTIQTFAYKHEHITECTGAYLYNSGNNIETVATLQDRLTIPIIQTSWANY